MRSVRVHSADMNKTPDTKTVDTAAIESLRTFAYTQCEHPSVSLAEIPHFVAFSYMCTAALQGEEWAVERIAPVVAEHAADAQWCAEHSHFVGNTLIATTLQLIRNTDCTRPDGAIARSFQA